MRTTVQKWGNSDAVRIPRSSIKERGLEYRTDVELTLEDGKLVIQPIKVVLSPKAYNGKVGLALFCPITSQVKGYPFEVAVSVGLLVSGVVLSDQVKQPGCRKNTSGTPASDPTIAKKYSI